MMNSAQMSKDSRRSVYKDVKGQDKLHFSNSPLLNSDPDSMEQ